MNITKRDGTVQQFDQNKIENAVTRALKQTEADSPGVAEMVTNEVCVSIKQLCDDGEDDPTICLNGDPSVEEIQDIVEETMMEMKLFETARAYILYRSQKNKGRERDLFKKRTNLRPYEYPELHEYVDAIRHSYWIHTEFNYTSDVHDFHVNCSPAEKESMKRAMLAIAQIEVAVKTFWSKIYDHLPKPEVADVGATFAESESRHSDAYANLLDILGLNEEFKQLINIPVIKERIVYLDKIINLSRSGDKREYVEAVLLFSLFIEHVSLFSQFLIMMSFNKHRNMFKGISNAVEATSKEEEIHGMFGIEVINILREENPEWFDGEMKETVENLCMEAYDTESKIVDWIFEEGELDFITKHTVKEFIKQRLNNSLESIGFNALFKVDPESAKETEWFDNEVIATKHSDFFQKRSINYNKRSSSITSEDLF